MPMRNRYPPLASRGDSIPIRLVTVQPGLPDDAIACQLQQVFLPLEPHKQHNLSYNAVSYTFGAEYPQHDIALGVWSLAVRHNLWHFLKQWRHTTDQITLWIDSICINQQDLEERAQQIRVMDRIYEGASKVIVWLGVADENSRTAMSVIASYRSQAAAEILKLTEVQYQALLSWSRRPYWRRTWIVQEFLLAQDLVLVCGDDKLPWFAVETFLMHLESVGSRSSSLSGLIGSPAINLMLQRKLKRHKAPLAELLLQNRHTEAHESRDRIYGTLGLASDYSSKSTLQVSYSIDKRLLIFEVIRHCKIQAVDCLRWIRYLAEILDVGKESSEKIVGQGRVDHTALEGHHLEILGFDVGSILQCGSMNDLMGHKDDYREFTTQFTSLCEEDTQKGFLSYLLGSKDKDFDRIEKCADSLIHTGHNMDQQDETRSSQPRRSKRMFIIASGSGRRSNTGQIGIACGRISSGNRVVQFPGNDISLAMDMHRSDNKVAGVIYLPNTSAAREHDPVYDTVTGMLCNSDSMQSEADCEEDAQYIHLHLTLVEALALAG